MSVASELEDLRRALAEVDVLTDLTRTTFGDTNWMEPDSDVVDVMATLIRLIDKSSFSAMSVFHRLQRALADASERRDRPAPGGPVAMSAQAPEVGGRDRGP
jgi:hypothetical protein